MNKNIILGGCAVFAMFFGSGNIVLPLQLGQKLGPDWFMAFLGFCISGVVVPLLGLIAVVLLNGNSEKFFSPLKKWGSFFLQLIVLSLNGPFGIVPRCSSIALGALNGCTNGINPHIFSALFCIIVGLLIITKDRIMPIICKVLTPIKLICLISVVLIGIILAPCDVTPKTLSLSSGIDGGLYGYLTMDLGGAIYFAALAIGYLKLTGTESKNELLKNGLKVSYISATLLTVMYLGFFMLGVGYRDMIIGVKAEDIFPTIINLSLGGISTYVICITVIIACITTAVAFLSAWVIFIAKKIERFGLDYKIAVFIGSLLTYCISLIGFHGIVQFMSPILNIIYPILIALTIINIRKVIAEKKK